LLSPRVFRVLSRLAQTRRVIHPEHPSAAHDYNLGVTASKRYTRTMRSEVYYRLLSLTPDVRHERLLIVGPRDVHELMIAWCYGYSWRNIDAIDLYATHRKIRVMDMERMTFEDASFDAAAMSNTLSYATDMHKALSEVSRVLKPGGLFAFGQTHVPKGSWPGNRVSGHEMTSMLLAPDFETLYHDYRVKVNSLGQYMTAHDYLVRRTV
jgi:SAM-dependent methyltransferase